MEDKTQHKFEPNPDIKEVNKDLEAILKLQREGITTNVDKEVTERPASDVTERAQVG